MNASKSKNNPQDAVEQQQNSSRRTFLTRLWAGLGFLALVELIAVGTAFLRRDKAGPAARDHDSIVDCGSVDQYQPGTVTAFIRGRFYLARLQDGGFLAISRQCTHLGCTVPWVETEKRFACPCHASAFDITGQVINAPAPRALDIFSLSIQNNRIAVDAGRPMRRSGYEKAQVIYPKRS